MKQELPKSLRAAGFDVRAGLDQGLSPGTLRGPSFVTPFRGVRTVHAPTTLLERSLAFGPLLRDWQALGGRSALAVLGLPLPWERTPSTSVEVVSAQGRARPVRAGVQVRRIPATLLTTRNADGVRVASAPLAWALMGARSSVHDLVMIGDAIVSTSKHYPNRRLPGPLATIEALRGIAELWEGRAGAAKLRQALPWIRERVESPRESEMRLFIVEAGLPEPEVQITIYDPATGRRLGRADLLHRDARVVEEYEGEGHRSKQQWDRDIQKYRDFERIGLHVVRATNRDFVPNADRWLADLAAVLARRSTGAA